MRFRQPLTVPVFAVAVTAFWFSAFTRGAEPVPAGAFGHSVHGEAFDEGPRQAAYLMEGMPDITFPADTKSAEAQKFFNQGVGQLHGFWYFEAERSFRQVAMLDTNCVMAYWGLAMANVQNQKRARQFIEKAVKLTNGLPRREWLYVESLRKFYLEGEKNDAAKHREYVRSLEQIVEEFPEDVEAKALLAFKVWENNGRARISSHTATDALAREVLAAQPMHPMHHGRIHLWNNEADRRALNSAARCGQGAPGIAHMWHMPGHTYSGLHRYADAAWQQEASARVDHAYMMRNRVLPDQIHNYAHNNEWLVRTLNHLGRVPEAIELAKNLIELPRHPKYNRLDLPSKKDKARAPGRNGSASLGRARLIETLVRWELWDQLIKLGDTMYLEPTSIPEEQAKRAHALGLAFFGIGNSKGGDARIAEIEAAIKQQRELRHEDLDDAELDAKEEKKPDDQVAKAMTDVLQPHAARIKRMENALAELRVHRSLAAGDTNNLKKAIEDLKDVPKERLARIWILAGEPDKAIEVARAAVEGGTNQVQLLANYIDLLARAGKKDEAGEMFPTLRQIGSQASLDLPVLSRVASVARSLDLPDDWRETYVPATDTGDRPPLDRLGPFHWQPTIAPEWTLRDSDNDKVALKDFKGRPVVVVFYLGSGCLHCIEQLNAFAPKTRDFAEAGISIVAISTESVADLKNTLEKSSENGTFPFPVVSDESLGVFKLFRAYDDFERMPLHGSFLIDAQGLTRWHDISYEPFSDVDFLLAESNRLLALPGAPVLAKATRPNPLLSPRAASQRN
jgi:peroxiredoxin